MSIPRGNTAREERTTSNRISLQEKNNIFPIGIKTPLELGSKETETLFKMHYKIEDQINDNLKNLLMTKKGEKLCFSDYGTKLYEIYSSDEPKEIIYQKAMNEISSAVLKYMPNIELINYYSKIIEDTKELEIINQDKTKLRRLEHGFNFYNSNQNIKINKGEIIKGENSDNKDVVYQITVEYSIPILYEEENKTFSLTMNLITSK